MEDVAAKFLENIPKTDIMESLAYNYKRRLTIYKLTDEKMKKKYGMDFKEFEKLNVVKAKDFSWDVESDAMEWEHSIIGMRYVEKKLAEIKKHES